MVFCPPHPPPSVSIFHGTLNFLGASFVTLFRDRNPRDSRKRRQDCGIYSRRALPRINFHLGEQKRLSPNHHLLSRPFPGVWLRMRANRLHLRLIDVSFPDSDRGMIYDQYYLFLSFSSFSSLRKGRKR
jgi:hypothetical protein